MLAVAVSHRHGRYGMRAALFGDAQDLVVYGGFANVDGSGLSNTDREGLGDIWVYRFGTRAWERKRSLPIADDLGGNEGYGSSAVVGSTMIVFGARRMLRRSQPVYSNSYAQFSVDSGAYEFLPPISGPSPVFPSARTGQPVCPPYSPTCYSFALLSREASRIRPPALCCRCALRRRGFKAVPQHGCAPLGTHSKDCLALQARHLLCSRRKWRSCSAVWARKAL
jgi:hypothetical protein